MMNRFSYATNSRINAYKDGELCKLLCGEKKFGSRHWEYPWAMEQSGIRHKTGLRILDVAPDLTFPYASFLEERHQVTFIDLERRQWSDTVAWGARVSDLALKSDFRIMDVCGMSFPDETFDTIFCISVLEHIICPTQDPDTPGLEQLCAPGAALKALAEMRRCLKPGGSLVLTIDIYGGEKWTPCFGPWDIREDLRLAGFDVRDIPRFDREQLFSSPETFISHYHGPYITLGFCLDK